MDCTYMNSVMILEKLRLARSGSLPMRKVETSASEGS
jgi:hypothetical protein